MTAAVVALALLAMGVCCSAQLTFQKGIITTAADGAISVHAVDVNGDGHMDVLAASVEDNTVSVFLNGGETGGTPTTWTEQVITDTADGALSVYAADVDGDTDIDVLVASRDDDTVSTVVRRPSRGRSRRSPPRQMALLRCLQRTSTATWTLTCWWRP